MVLGISQKEAVRKITDKMKKKILVVDNDMLILEFMHDLLSREGYEVVTAEDGLVALNILKSLNLYFEYTNTKTAK